MKRAFFDILAYTGSQFLLFLVWVSQVLQDIIKYIFAAIIWLSANVIRIILSLIDSEKYHHANQVSEQREMTSELDILARISAVKEDALKRKVWTEGHSLALSQLGNALYANCDWSERDIHNYIRGVVEDIPGLSYAVKSDDDEEDGIELD